MALHAQDLPVFVWKPKLGRASTRRRVKTKSPMCSITCSLMPSWVFPTAVQVDEDLAGCCVLRRELEFGCFGAMPMTANASRGCGVATLGSKGARETEPKPSSN